MVDYMQLPFRLRVVKLGAVVCESAKPIGLG
jgi:hypothetical protein